MLGWCRTGKNKLVLGGIVSFLKTLVSHRHGFNSSSLPTFIPTRGMGTNGNSEVGLRMSLRESPEAQDGSKMGSGTTTPHLSHLRYSWYSGSE